MTFSLSPSGSAGIIGHVRPTALVADVNGWYILDGRAAAALPAVAQAGLALLGLAALPNMNTFSERQNGALNTTGGSDANISLTSANLPTAAIAGTLDQQANPHTHSINSPNVRHDRAGQHTGTANNAPVGMGPVIDVSESLVGGSHNHVFDIPFGGAAQPIPIENGYMSTRFHIYLGS